MDEKFESKFKEIAARYCSVKAEDIKNDMSFRDDLGLSSLDLMTFLGDLEDEFDVEFEPEEIAEMKSVEMVLKILQSKL